ncbi:hypothetical protein [Allofrancisella guangzhouensis]|uniref:hypothetical protein n=2 Tax=Allofrancisella guangzhouensis TaxID=594679 RepID=UPI001470591E|nr:hypothetical protein [Allofrancisella guangzhouensis]
MRVYANKEHLNLPQQERRNYRESGLVIIQNYIDACESGDVYLKDLLINLKLHVELIVKCMESKWQATQNLLKIRNTNLISDAYEIFNDASTIEEKVKLICLLQEIVFSEKTFFSGLQDGQIVNQVTNMAISGFDLRGTLSAMKMREIHNDIGETYPCNILIYIAVLYIYDLIDKVSFIEIEEDTWGDKFNNAISLNSVFIAKLLEELTKNIKTYDFRTLKFDPIVIKDAKIDPNLISYKYAHTELTRNSNKDDINDSAALFVFYKLFEQIFAGYNYSSHTKFKNYRKFIWAYVGKENNSSRRSFDQEVKVDNEIEVWSYAKKRNLRSFCNKELSNFGNISELDARRSFKNFSNQNLNIGKEEIFYDAYGSETDLINAHGAVSRGSTLYKSCMSVKGEKNNSLCEERKARDRSSVKEIGLGSGKKSNSSGTKKNVSVKEFIDVKEEVLRILGRYLKLNSLDPSTSWNITLRVFDQKHHAGRMREVIKSVRQQNTIGDISNILKGQKTKFEDVDSNKQPKYTCKERIGSRWNQDVNKIKNVPKNLAKSKFYQTICTAINICERC